MSQSNLHLLDLPNELLFIILNKFGNVNALYSLLGRINERFDCLLQDNVFTKTLHLIKISSTYDYISSLDDSILSRFCSDILPKIHHNVKHLTLESKSMKRILLCGNYSNLVSLKVFHFTQDIAFFYFTDQSIFRHIFKDQIIELTLLVDDDLCRGRSLKDYTVNVYVPILTFFKRLKHLSISIPYFYGDYPSLSICNLSSTMFSSSILTKLSIDVYSFDDCRCLLDGRLKQLTILIVRIYQINYHSSIIHMIDDNLPHLKCFSLICYEKTDAYDNRVLPLLHRMTYLEKLTLYLRLHGRNIFVDGTHLHREILMHMSQLHAFIFYISTEIEINDSIDRLSDNDIQQTFTNIGYYRIACAVNYYRKSKAICHIFSLPFIFDRLIKICSHFPAVIYEHVTELTILDDILFNYEFIVRIRKAFPSLDDLTIIILQPPSDEFGQDELRENQSSAIMKYLHLSGLTTLYRSDDYLRENFTRDTT
ncbi:unnamed protein product [Rotaria sp. Silwood2]|nr:unnamed protein product [Rotaria sp. Silwood2]CAF4108881.1 unnamed protein product [Rotaria sp. Silwood2]